MTTAPADTKPASGDGEIWGHGTILIVDDSEENRAFLRGIFERLGYEVIEAPGAATGLTVAASRQPDCIVLDLHMPGVGGFEVLARLKRDARTEPIPVIMLTGAEDTLRNVEQALRGGAVDYLSKPISPLRVAVRVRAAIERRDLMQEVRELRSSLSALADDVGRSVIATKAALAAAPSSDEVTVKCLHEIAAAWDAFLPRLQQSFAEPGLTTETSATALQVIDVAAIVTKVVEAVSAAAGRQGRRIKMSPPAHRLTAPGTTASAQVVDGSGVEHVLATLIMGAVTCAFATEVEVHLHPACDDWVQVEIVYAGILQSCPELAMCERLIRRQRGQLETRTEADGRSRLVVSLPCGAD